MLIVYCETCGKRIVDDELHSGAARKIDENQYVCSKCAVAPLAAALSSALQNTPSGKVPSLVAADIDDGSKLRTRSGSRNKRTSGGNEIVQRATTTVGRQSQPPEKIVAVKKDSTMTYVAIAAGVIVVIGIAATLMGGGVKTPPPVAASADKNAKPSAPPLALKKEPAATPALIPVVTSPIVPMTKTPVSEPAQPPKAARNADKEMEEFRNNLAEEKLKEAQEWFAKNPADPWGYSDKLNDIANSYRSTPAGTKAKEIAASLTLPPKPAPVELSLEGSGNWTALFDGKSVESLKPECLHGWKIDNGALVNVPNKEEAVQFRPDLDNVEIRIRFQLVGDIEYLAFRALQGEGAVSVVFDRSKIGALPPNKTHELLFAVRAPKAKAFLNQKPLAIVTGGIPTKGKIQIRCREGTLRILSIDHRPLANTPAQK